MLSTVSLFLALALVLPGQTTPSAQEHAEQAMRFARQGDLKHAEGELRKAVELSPADPALLTSLGGILAMEGDLQQANSYLARAVKLNPQDAVSRRNLAANQWQLGKLKEAHENLDRLIRANPRDKASIFLLGMVLEKEKDYTRSGALLESVPDVLEQQPDGWAALASSYYHTNRRENAQSALRKLLNRPNDPRVIFKGGDVAMEGSDYPTAEALFLSIRSSYTDPAAVDFQIALAQYRDHRADQSEKTLVNAIESSRARSDAYLLLCKILVDRKADTRALRTATQGSQMFPDSYELLSMKGSVEMKSLSYSAAVVSYQRAAKMKPDSSDTKRNLATAEWRAGMRKQAVADFDLAIRQFPRDAATCQIYGTLLLEDGSPENRSKAVALLKVAIGLDASSIEPRYQLANLELEDGKPEQAVPYLEDAMKLDSRDSRLHFAISRAYRRLGRSSDADKEMETYQKLKAAEQPQR